MTTQPALPQKHHRNQTTQWLDTECNDLVRDFWAAAGGEEPFPRSLELALGFALPVTLVRLAGLHTENARVWLRARSRDIQFGDGPRPLHGCLIAYRGNGIIFLDASDSGDEQRFTLAHEIAHFLVDYMLPRRRMLTMLGSDFAEVLDGTRAATARERLTSILHGANAQPHVNLMLRSVAGSDAISIWSVENRADRVALALLAPPERVLEIGQAESGQARRNALEDALVRNYGLPPVPAQRYAAELLQMQQPSDSWLSALRALVRTHDSGLVDER